MKTVLFNAFDIILLVTAYQCILFSIFIINQKSEKKYTNSLLALFLITQAAIPIDNLITFGEAFSQYAVTISPDLTYLFGIAYWLEAPLMLLYVRSMIYKDYKPKPIDLLYFLPFLLFAIYHVFTWVILDDEIQRAILQVDKIDNAYWLDRLFYFLRQNFRVICSFIALYELMRYQDLIKNEVASTRGVDLNWLKLLVFGFLLIRLSSLIISVLIIFNFDFEFDVINHESVGLASNVIILLLISKLVYFALSKSILFKGISIDKKSSSDKTNEFKEVVSPETIEHIVNYIETQKPYLHPMLTLESLANQLNLPPRVLSSILNKHFEKNFYEFINSYRIEESKRLIAKNINKKFTMLDILNDAGFNSKATFNTFFKKQVGMTPREYKQTLIENRKNAHT